MWDTPQGKNKRALSQKVLSKCQLGSSSARFVTECDKCQGLGGDLKHSHLPCTLTQPRGELFITATPQDESSRALRGRGQLHNLNTQLKKDNMPRVLFVSYLMCCLTSDEDWDT